MQPYALAALAALLYVAGYPAGLGLWPLSCIALAPLLWVLETAELGPRAALKVGGSFALLAQLAGYAFLPETLLRFSGLPFAVCLVAYVALCAFQGAGAALWLAALASLRARGASTLVLAPPLWVAHELLWPSVFEAPLGAALHDAPGLIQMVELGGVALASLLVASINATAAALMLGFAQGDRGLGARALRGLAVIAVVLLASSARLAHVEQRVQAARALRVGLVQASLGAETKRQGPDAYAERYVKLSQAIGEPIDLLLWPETALAKPVPADVPDMRAAHPSLERVRSPLLAGAVTYEGGRLYNSAILFGPDRGRIGRIDKRVLLPFAEAIPLGDRFPILYDWIPGAGHFTPGSGVPVLSLAGVQLAIFICYEDMLPAAVRRAALGSDADVLVSLSNDAWFGESRAAYTHFAVARLRAIELRRTLVRATNTGVSAVVEPTGRLQTRPLPEHAPATRVAAAPLLDDATLYARFGRTVAVAVLAAWLALAALPTLVHRRR